MTFDFGEDILRLIAVEDAEVRGTKARRPATRQQCLIFITEAVDSYITQTREYLLMTDKIE